MKAHGSDFTFNREAVPSLKPGEHMGVKVADSLDTLHVPEKELHSLEELGNTVRLVLLNYLL